MLNVHPEAMPEELARMLGDYQEKIRRGFVDNEWPDLKTALAKLCKKSTTCREHFDDIVTAVNSDPNLLSDLLNEQHYKLSLWRDSVKTLNYRRFFTVNSLICLRMENDPVFDRYHRFISKLVTEKRFNGLRIDHIDGLKNPAGYLENLRLLAGDDTYIVAEKILGPDEELVHGLPMQGTSGYDYLGIVNNVFTYKNNYPQLNRFYRQITGIDKNLDEIIYDRKKFMLTERMHGEWDNLARLFDNYGFADYSSGLTHESVKEAIGEFLVHFPVYKLYSQSLDFSFDENLMMREVFSKAVRKTPSLEKALRAVEKVFFPDENTDEKIKMNAYDFFLRCMQFTGPLMAKGVEDTVMYYYNCFIAHNEVGDYPGASGISADEYHERMLRRQKNHPMSMNATSTHDTKRGEDVRARLNVISEIPEEWMKNVRQWMSLNEDTKTVVKGKSAPDANEEYFIYQTLAGVFPFIGDTDDFFLERMDEYLVKALREAKTNSEWNDPDEDYEKAVKDFTRKILTPGSDFLISFIPFQQKLAAFGLINSLSQVMLKCMSPGIPDFYQGTELWDLSMVDPDNRRAVDYSLRSYLLKEMIRQNDEDRDKFLGDIFINRNDGRIKFWLTYQLLKERKSNPELFLHGRYVPLSVKGRHNDHILSFARVQGNTWYIVVIPLFTALLPGNKNMLQPVEIEWDNTRIILPDNAPAEWTIFSHDNEKLKTEGHILLSDLMSFPFPVYVKGRKKPLKRYDGVLAHLTSLPGKYGTGDLGEEAFEFVNILRDSGQTFWQILPFNPVEKDYGYSPYSSISAFAGNLLFLSPDFLIRSNLLSGKSFMKAIFKETDRTNFKKAVDFRNMLLDEVFTNFFCRENRLMKKAFDDFCEREKYWLDDFALFLCLKNEFRGKPWFEWPDKIKNRDKENLRMFAGKYEMEIKKSKLGQFLFQDQWISLKKYTNINGIRIIGDMSFYVNYDSADVWAHPGYFNLDENKDPLTVAGVPPDYFSSTGQLWGMPVYNWKQLKKDNYHWWMMRIRRNMELCDFIRFDHFRGFSEYWEVPFGEETAVKGEWTAGPGKDFFGRVKKEFPSMPFIAEDLGDIDDKVYMLRDDFSLPGMVVLQFAFGDNTPSSVYIPHNHAYNSIVYTGTHDNNTIKGWFITEIKEKNRNEAEAYLGHPVIDTLCHEDFIRMAYRSVAKIAIIPVQDILGLDERARLNKPSTVGGKNWDWKMKAGDFKKFPMEKMRKMAVLFGRI
jgi:malto-oligosyltrehalose synthase/4-alpha-glucanotransferase